MEGKAITTCTEEANCLTASWRLSVCSITASHPVITIWQCSKWSKWIKKMHNPQRKGNYIWLTIVTWQLFETHLKSIIYIQNITSFTLICWVPAKNIALTCFEARAFQTFQITWRAHRAGEASSSPPLLIQLDAWILCRLLPVKPQQAGWMLCADLSKSLSSEVCTSSIDWSRLAPAVSQEISQKRWSFKDMSAFPMKEFSQWST